MQKRINGYLDNFYVLIHAAIGKGFSAQLALFSLTEKWKKVLR